MSGTGVEDNKGDLAEWPAEEWQHNPRVCSPLPIIHRAQRCVVHLQHPVRVILVKSAMVSSVNTGWP